MLLETQFIACTTYSIAEAYLIQLFTVCIVWWAFLHQQLSRLEVLKFGGKFCIYLANILQWCIEFQSTFMPSKCIEPQLLWWLDLSSYDPELLPLRLVPSQSQGHYSLYCFSFFLEYTLLSLYYTWVLLFQVLQHNKSSVNNILLPMVHI